MTNDIQSLISAVCDNRASSEELSRLSAELFSDESVRDAYLRYVDLHAALSDEALPQIDSDIIDYHTASPLDTSLRRGLLWHNGWALLAIAASLLLIATLGYTIFRPSQGVLNPKPAALASLSPVATMLLSEKCTWGGTSFDEGQRLEPGPISLSAGTAVLRFDGGAELVLVGPAEMELESPGRAIVRRGEIIVKATNGAEGFVITTPTSEVIDLGTEFAVNVGVNGATEVHVLDGEVSYRAISAASELAKILRAGEGVAIDAQGRPRAVPMNSPRFEDFVNRVNPRSRSDLLVAYEGFNYSAGTLPLAQSTVGKGWAGPWRKRLASERRRPARDVSPNQFEIVHGQMNVTWPVPGGRLGMLKLPPGESYYVRPLATSIQLDRDDVTFFSLMVRETERRATTEPPHERLRLTFRASSRYYQEAVSFGHGPGYRPTIQTGDGVAHTSPMILPTEQTTLWIGKIVSREHNEDEVCFRVYGEEDALGYAEPATWHVVTRGVKLNGHLDRVLLSSIGNTFRIVDELRIGPTWRSVAPMKDVQP